MQGLIVQNDWDIFKKREGEKKIWHDYLKCKDLNQ